MAWYPRRAARRTTAENPRETLEPNKAVETLRNEDKLAHDSNSKFTDCLTLIHHIHKKAPCNFLSVYVFKEIHVTTLPSAIKYVILGSISVFGLTAATLLTIQI